MITSRFIEPYDRTLLESSLKDDEFHKDTGVEFFYEEGTVTSVFSDDESVILFVRGRPLFHEESGSALVQLDLQYVKNMDAKRNIKTMLEGFPIIEERARKAGFLGFIFNSDVPLLRKFCVKRLGFLELNEQFLYKVIQKNEVS